MSLVRRARPRGQRPPAVIFVAVSIVIAACGSAAVPPSAPSAGASAAASDGAESTGARATLQSPATTATPRVPSPPPSPGPTVLPGESWIAFQRWTQATGARLRLIRPDGSGDHELLPDLAGDQLHPDWSPDGSRLAFEADHAIWTVDVDGRDARRVAPCTAPCRDLGNPAWSPDGRSIAFDRVDLIAGQNPGSRIQSVDLASGKVKTLFMTVGAEYATYPRWSPDGHSLVVELDRYPDTNNDTSTVIGSAIAVVDLGTSRPKARLLTAWPMFAAYPDWAPKGDWIVFSTYDLGTRDAGGFTDPFPPSDLYMIRPVGSGRTQLTRNPRGMTLVRNSTASGPLSTQPTWSPDGSKIIFTQVDGEAWPGWTMATIGADGSGLASATGTEPLLGTHPRLRPAR